MSTEDFAQLAKTEDQKAVIRQLLIIRYESLDEALLQVVAQLAEMPSNEMLRLLLTCSREQLLMAVKQSTIHDQHHPKDLFNVTGPLQEYYLKKQSEREALEALARLKFGEIDEVIASAIEVLLQSPMQVSIQSLYISTYEALAHLSQSE